LIDHDIQFFIYFNKNEVYKYITIEMVKSSVFDKNLKLIDERVPLNPLKGTLSSQREDYPIKRE